MDHPEHEWIIQNVQGYWARTGGRKVPGRNGRYSFCTTSWIKIYESSLGNSVPRGTDTSFGNDVLCTEPEQGVLMLSGLGWFIIIRPWEGAVDTRAQLPQHPAAVSRLSQRPGCECPPPARGTWLVNVKRSPMLTSSILSQIASPPLNFSVPLNAPSPLKDLCIRYIFFLFLPLKLFWSDGFYF